jgi:hypothetical protein
MRIFAGTQSGTAGGPGGDLGSTRRPQAYRIFFSSELFFPDELFFPNDLGLLIESVRFAGRAGEVA